MDFSEFLERTPPNQEVRIANIWNWFYPQGSDHYRGLNSPEIQLHCPNEACNGTRFFRCITVPARLQEGKHLNVFTTYRCSNCQKSLKTFALTVKWDDAEKGFSEAGVAIKFGVFAVLCGNGGKSRLKET